MKNITIQYLSIMVVLVGLTSAKSYAQIDFRVKSDNQNLIRVDEKISFSLEIENIRYSKVKVMYPIYEEQLFSFLKEEGGPWSEISTLRIIDGSYEITLKPGQIIKKSYSFFSNIMLLPNKKYLLKIMYYPKALKGEYYNPNKEVGCPKRLCKEHTIVFTTDSLSENSLDEWRWLEKHNLRQVYSINGYRDLDRFMFEEARRFIEQFPNSVFLHVAKVLYIEYIAYYAPIKDVSIEMIENSFQFCQDIEKEHPDLLADYLLSLNKRREQIKN